MLKMRLSQNWPKKAISSTSNSLREPVRRLWLVLCLSLLTFTPILPPFVDVCLWFQDQWLFLIAVSISGRIPLFLYPEFLSFLCVKSRANTLGLVIYHLILTPTSRQPYIRSKGSGEYDEIATVCAHAFGFIARNCFASGMPKGENYSSIKSNPLKWPEMEPRFKCMLVKFCRYLFHKRVQTKISLLITL